MVPLSTVRSHYLTVLLYWTEFKNVFRLVFVLIRFPEGIDKYAEKFELQQIRVKQS